MKYGFIREHRKHLPVARLCRQLAVSRTGFHAWLDRPVSARHLADQRLLVDIRRVHLEHRQAYGGVKTWRTLNDRGIACGKHRVARLRREAGIEARRSQRQRIMVEHHKIPDIGSDHGNALKQKNDTPETRCVQGLEPHFWADNLASKPGAPNLGRPIRDASSGTNT